MILDHVQDPNYRPVKPKVIVKQLKLRDEQERDVKRAIKQLIKQNKLTWGPNHLVMKSTKKETLANEVQGVFRRAAGGYGFVTPNESHPLADGVDVFIPQSKTADAANGDTVRVRISRRSVDSAKQKQFEKSREKKDSKKVTDRAEVRISGRIIDIIERRTHQFVGTYRERGRYGFVKVDGNVFETDILVGDAGAKNCRVGDKVVIEMAHFPSVIDEGEGVVVDVLGPRGKAGVDTLTVIREFGLPGEFPEKVLADARRQAAMFDDSEIPKGRTDFRGETVITIDPKEARDFDDAVSLKQIENGHWQLGVHIADVSHFVQPNTDMDNEAYARGTSVYLPDKVIPMLPEIISNNLASLQPDRVRYVTSAIVEFTADGAPVATDLHRGVIKSAHRFNYEEIDDYLADEKPWKKKLTPEVFDLVRRMHTLAMILRKRRMDRGAIELTLPEIKIELDENGRACGATETEYTESHQIIEEFMLAANEAVARELSDQGLFLVRRVHENPSPAKLKDLTTFVKGVGINAGSLNDRFEIKRVIADARGRPEEHAIHYAVLRAMQKAIYSPKEVGHYALASPEYCHFTSPIRRYPDLIIHRMVGSLVDGKKPAADFEHLLKLGNHCSALEQRAEKAERTLIRLKLLNLLAERLDEEFHAVVTGVESFGVFAQLDEVPADGLIPVKALPLDQYQFDRSTRTLTGFRSGNTFRLGDRLTVRIKLVDPDARLLELELVESSSGQPPKKPKHKKRSSNWRQSGARNSKKKSAKRGSPKPASKKGSSSKKKNSTKTGKKKSTGKGSAKAKQASKRKSKAAVNKRLQAAKSGRPQSRKKKKR
jgi:ribonuclease R